MYSHEADKLRQQELEAATTVGAFCAVWTASGALLLCTSVSGWRRGVSPS